MLKKIILLANIVLCGCADTPSTHFYVLEPLAQPSQASHKAGQRIIGIGPLTLPSLLDRKQIVTRTENNGVDVAEFHQWAAPLKDTVIQVIRQNIATLQANDIIRVYPWSAFGKVDYYIVIDITRFESQLGKAVTLEATWAILNEKNHQMMSNGQTKIEQPLSDSSYSANAAALSSVLSKFSLELAQAVRALQRQH